MQDIWVAILLGIIEGLTEFLPVSSTGHLLLAEDLLGFHAQGEVFPVVIQFGAILSVVVAYAGKFGHVARNFFRERESRNFVLGVIIAFIPSAIVGVLLHSYIKTYLFNPTVIAVALITGGIAILFIEPRTPTPRYTEGDKLPLWKCLQIGLCQCLALVPGVSRSGATIMGGMLLGVERKAVAEFTFYLAVPTMLGAFVYDLYKNWAYLSPDDGMLIAVGFVVSFLAAYVVVKTFIAFISRYGFAPFAWYRIALGVLILALIFAPAI
jgi:undecaprenyl-diphosphatase